MRSALPVTRSELLVMRSELLDTRSALRGMRSALPVTRSELLVMRSALLVTRSELLVMRSALPVTRSELLVMRSEFLGTRTEPSGSGSEHCERWPLLEYVMSMNFDASDLRRALATHFTWFHLGSKLFHAAQMTTPKDPLPSVPDVVVGGVYAADVTDPAHYWSDFERIPLMLYAMAVECWLKGIIVKKMSAPVQEELKVLLGKLSPTFVEDYFRGQISSADEAIVEERAEKDKQLTADALSKLKTLSDHKLMSMAKEVGLNLDAEEKELLEVLSHAIMLGRYPASFKPDIQVDLSIDKYDHIVAELGNKILANAG